MSHIDIKQGIVINSKCVYNIINVEIDKMVHTNTILPMATILVRFTKGWYIYMKTWSQSCHSFHAVKALASPKLSKRATPKAPRLCTYIGSTLDNER